MSKPRRSRTKRAARSRAFRTLRCDPLEDRRLLATLTVNSNADGIDYGDNALTLREAVAIVNQATRPAGLSPVENGLIDDSAGNAFGVDDTIVFHSSLLSTPVIELDDAQTDPELRQLTIANAVTIDAGSLGITIDASSSNPASASRIFHVLPGIFDDEVLPAEQRQPQVSFRGLTLAGGNVPDDEEGGAVWAESPIQIHDTSILSSVAGIGGGVFVDVRVPNAAPTETRSYEGLVFHVVDSDFQGNTASLSGGAIAIRNGYEVTDSARIEVPDVDGKRGDGLGYRQTFLLERVEILDNEATDYGGGLFAHIAGNDRLDVVDSLISGNTALYDDDNTVALEDQRGYGGGLAVIQQIAQQRILGAGYSVAYWGHDKAIGAKFTLTGSTVANNKSSNSGGGIYTFNGAGAETAIVDSRITGNRAAIDEEGESRGFSAGPRGLLNSTISSFSDSIPNSGGGIYAYLFSGDDNVQPGGGLIESGRSDDNGEAKLTITGSTVDNNRSGGHGGGISVCTKREDATREVQSIIDIVNSTISTNSAGLTARLRGTLQEFSGDGGGVYLAHYNVIESEVEGFDATFINSTITLNDGVGITASGMSRTRSGGVFSQPARNNDNSQGNTVLHNTIIAGNSDRRLRNENASASESASNFFGAVVADEVKRSLFGPDADPLGTFFPNTESNDSIDDESLGAGDGNLIAAGNDPQLGGLADNGGPSLPGGFVMLTHMPLVSSPAIDEGSGALANDPLSGTPLCVDQRVHGRFFDVNGLGASGSQAVDIGAVEFGASPLLLGDYNGDSQVDAADYTTWRDAFGQEVARYCGADGNGDGVVNEADYDVWVANYGAGVPLPGDFNSDGVVNASDYTVWRTGLGTTYTESDYNVWAANFGAGMSTASQILATMSVAIGDYNADGAVDHLDRDVWTATLGSTTDLRADGNNDGVIDAADYTVWRDQVGSTLSIQRFQALAGANGAVYVVSTTADEYDTDYSYGDLSLREAVQLANGFAGPATILLTAGSYQLSRQGSESGAEVMYNDLDITGTVTIIGDGAGVSVIEGFDDSYTGSAGSKGVFHVDGPGSQLELSKLTVTGTTDTSSSNQAFTIQATNESTLVLSEVAAVNNSTDWAVAVVKSLGAHTTIERSVFTGNYAVAYTAVHAGSAGGIDGSLTLSDSIFALNSVHYYAPNIAATGTVVINNLGGNLYDDDQDGFFTSNPGPGDHYGSTQFVVTTVADTYDHTDNEHALSIREAIDLANQSGGQGEVWLPAWKFELTRDRATYGSGSATDTDIAFGDLDIKDHLVIRGVSGLTEVAWSNEATQRYGRLDSVFDLLGDGNQDGQTNQEVDTADYTVRRDQHGQGSGTSTDWEVFSGDYNDDGQVDLADQAVWAGYHGNSLDLFGITL